MRLTSDELLKMTAIDGGFDRYGDLSANTALIWYFESDFLAPLSSSIKTNDKNLEISEWYVYCMQQVNNKSQVIFRLKDDHGLH